MVSRGLSRFGGVGFVVAILVALSVMVGHNSFAACTSSGCSWDTTFSVNVNEVLSVSIERPNEWVTGDVGQYLTNKITLSITSNSSAGLITATMKSATATANLVNELDSSSVITPLTGSTPTPMVDSNKWGYCIANAGASLPITPHWNGMVGSGGTPIQVASYSFGSGDSNTVAKDIYFMAKADATIAAGTYSNNVVISVVTGVIDNDNPVTPVNPIVPGDDPQPNNDSVNGDTQHGNTPNGTVVATTITPNGTTTTTTTDSYAKPAGAREVVNTDEGVPLAAGLAVTAGVAAATGVVLFFLAKRNRDDEEEDDDGVEKY
jgi:hypothetical protein